MMALTAPFIFWNENPVTITEELPETFDSVVIVSSKLSNDHIPSYLRSFLPLLKIHKEVDDAFERTETFVAPPISEVSNIKRLVYSPTGPLERDYDDVRRFADAASKGMKRLIKAGAKNPVLVVLNSSSRFKFPSIVALLAAAEAIYVPLEIRECFPKRVYEVKSLGFWSSDVSSDVVRIASAIERGRVLCRDIGGSDPERMTPPNVAEYLLKIFADTVVKVEVIEDENVIKEQFPLLYAVNRAARATERHTARVILLSYEPEGSYDCTVGLVGKGVTYDTGGSDIKVGGGMMGMSRDKCGAAAVAGFFLTVATLKPKKIKVLGALAMVRNSVGPDGVVADEIIRARSGKRVRIVNTDAEGRLAMVDLLCHLKEKVVEEKNPYLFTIATLTYHAHLTVGDGYSIIMDNGPAFHNKVGHSIQKAGDDIGDMFEYSTIRREDYDFHLGRSEYEDLVQGSNELSSRLHRGHQVPAAFLIMASGLDKHGIDSSVPLKYSHIDILASAGNYPEIPTAAPIPALTKRFLVPSKIDG